VEERDKAKKERKADYMRAYRKANKDHIDECIRDWLDNHPEYRKHQAEYQKRWREANREYASEYKKKWREENPDYEKNLFTGLAEKHPDGYVSDEGRSGENSSSWQGGLNYYPRCTELKVNRLAVLNNSDWTCGACGGRANEAHHIDGSRDNHSPENLLSVCRSCHKKLHRNKERLEEVYA